MRQINDPPPSRVHQLGRMSRTRLIEIYQNLASRDSYSETAMFAIAGDRDEHMLPWNRDQLIVAILSQEDTAAERLVCRTCKSTGWVCEAHPDKPWNELGGCSCSPGIPCPDC